MTAWSATSVIEESMGVGRAVSAEERLPRLVVGQLRQREAGRLYVSVFWASSPARPPRLDRRRASWRRLAWAGCCRSSTSATAKPDNLFLRKDKMIKSQTYGRAWLCPPPRAHLPKLRPRSVTTESATEPRTRQSRHRPKNSNCNIRMRSVPVRSASRVQSDSDKGGRVSSVTGRLVGAG